MRKNSFSFLSAVNKNVKHLLLLGVLFVSIGAASPDPSSTPIDLSNVPQLTLHEVQKSAAKNQYQIGDRIALLAELDPKGIESGEVLSLKLPEGGSKLEDQGWYIDPSTQFLNGVFRFIVSPIQTGNLTLPTLLVTKADGSYLGRTNPFTIQVSGPAENEVKPPELLEVTALSLPTKYWILFSILLLLVLGAIAYVAFRFWKKRKNQKPKVIPNQPSEADHTYALRRIAELYQKLPYSHGNLKPVAFGISEILKDFFSRRFKIDANESTTDEMMSLLKKEAISHDSLQEIQKLFESLDLLKFTKEENYLAYGEGLYDEMKVNAQLIIQKWALKLNQTGGQP